MNKKKEIQELFDNYRNLSKEQKEVADSVKRSRNKIIMKNIIEKYIF